MIETIFFSTRQGGVEGEMATSILRRLVGPYGLLKDIIKNKASVFDLFKPMTRPEITVDWKEFLNQVVPKW